MPKIKSLAELRKIKEAAQQSTRVRDATGTKIIVGMGTCGIAAGARQTMLAILDQLKQRDIHASVVTVGCIGMCSQEPLVDIERAGQARVTYGNVTAEKVPRLINEHLIEGRIVEEWVVGRIDAAEDGGPKSLGVT